MSFGLLAPLSIHREQIGLLEFKLFEADKQNVIPKTKASAPEAEKATLQTRLQEAHVEIEQLKEQIAVIERKKNQLQAETYKANNQFHCEDYFSTTRIACQ
jgi:chromosome segregation ATPase